MKTGASLCTKRLNQRHPEGNRIRCRDRPASRLAWTYSGHFGVFAWQVWAECCPAQKTQAQLCRLELFQRPTAFGPRWEFARTAAARIEASFQPWNWRVSRDAGLKRQVSQTSHLLRNGWGIPAGFQTLPASARRDSYLQQTAWLGIRWGGKSAFPFRLGSA